MVTNGTKFLLGPCPNSDRRSATRLLAAHTKSTFKHLYLYHRTCTCPVYVPVLVQCAYTCAILSSDPQVYEPDAVSKTECASYITSTST